MRARFAIALLLMLASCVSARHAAARDASPDGTILHERRGPVDATLSIDRTSAPTGTTINVTLVATAPTGFEITLPDAPDLDMSIAVRASNPRPNIPTEDGRQWQRTYRIDSLTPGTYDIPAFDVEVRDARDESNVTESTLTMPSFTVTFEGVADLKREQTALDELLHQPLELRDDSEDLTSHSDDGVPWLTIGWIAGIVALILALAAILARPRTSAASLEPIVPPDVRALTALAELESSSLIDDGAWDAFYTRLSWIVRTYIEDRWSIAAPEYTTDEFLARAPDHPSFPAESVEQLATMLRRADMVKFARHEAAADECRAAVAEARIFIAETTAAASTGAEEVT